MKPERHEKGWGYELWIANNDLYCGKILHFNKGKKCSWHYHKIKQETFLILFGKVQLKIKYKGKTSKKNMTPQTLSKQWKFLVILQFGPSK